jgi:hypothetical protein
LLVLFMSLALGGMVYARKNKYRYLVLLLFAIGASLLFFFQLNMHSDFLPRIRYTFVPLILLIIFAALGVGGLIAKQRTRLIGRTVAAGLVVGLLFVNSISIYSGPDELAEVAAQLTTLVSTTTATERLQRSIGLTGPPMQTEQILRVAGPLAPHVQSLMSLAHEEQVVVIYGKYEPLDTRRLNMIQSLADLSYNQFKRVPWAEASGALAAKPLVVLIVKDSLVQTVGAETMQSLQAWQQMHNYSVYFGRGAFEIWTSEIYEMDRRKKQ